MIRLITAGACALLLASCGALDGNGNNAMANTEAVATDSMAKLELGRDI